MSIMLSCFCSSPRRPPWGGLKPAGRNSRRRNDLWRALHDVSQTLHFSRRRFTFFAPLVMPNTTLTEYPLCDN